MAEEKPKIKPQPGPQEEFLTSEADIVIFGGAAYGGKTFGLLIESLRYVDDPRYNGVIFRRESPQITSGGGLWDTASQIYPHIGGEAKEHKLTYIFPSKAYIKFTHLQHEKDKIDHQGAQYVFVGFDELTHFSEGQFWYLLTRNRPPSGCTLKPYCRCTTNPEADTWVRTLVDWWIDNETGYAIKERAGILRYFTRIDEEIIWVDKDWVDEDGNRPKSITFIPSYIDDNPLGVKADPTYKSNLQAQDKVTRERLLKGNWNITYKGGMFNPDWFNIVDTAPEGIKWVRYWDRAATEPKDEEDDPDWTAGALCGMYGGELYIKDMSRFRETPAINEEKIKKCADSDGHNVHIGYEVEPGSSGKEVAEHYQKDVLKGYVVLLDHPKGSKVERCKPWCALAEHGHVYLVRGSWNRTFLAEAGSFPFGKKDQIDGVSGAYKLLTRDKYVWEYFKMSQTLPLTIQWKEAEGRPTLHYAAMYQHKDLSLWVMQALWDDTAGKLFVYQNWMVESPVPAIIGLELIRRMKLREYRHEKILCNDRMCQTEGHIRSPIQVMKTEIRKTEVRVNLVEAVRYDQAGAILTGSQMVALKQIYIDENCQEPARQIAGWTIDKGKPGEDDCGYCIALCMILSELRRRKLIKDKPPKPRDYNKKF